MPTSRRRLFSLLGLCSAVVLNACGGGGSMHVAPLAPVFTSTPPSAAAQDTPYSYSIAATDPSGGTVTFSLTTAPTGAALSGSSLAWTPPASQSRTSNSFAVRATTSEGGTATQSWTVSPTGTVTASMIETFWTPAGPQPFPDTIPIGAAFVPNADGSLTVIQGSFASPGIFSIPTVPAGYYWLVTGVNLTNLYDAIWTSSSTVDLGRDLPGSPLPVTSPQSTIFNFNLNGLDATASPSLVSVSTGNSPLDPNFSLDPPAEATTEAASVAVAGPVDWSKIENAFLMQYEPVSLGTLNSLVLGPALTVPDPGFTEGGTNTVSETLAASPQASLNVSVPGSQWAPLFDNVGPSAATVWGSWLSISAEPFVTGRNQSPNPFVSDLSLVAPTPVATLGGGPITLPPDFCLGGAVIPDAISINQPGILTDQTFGTLDYGDPFPSTWTRAVEFCQMAGVPIPVVGTAGTFPFLLSYGVAVASSSSPSLAPLAEPVLNPTINGANLFAQSTIATTSVTLSWSTPQGTTPFGYRIAEFIQSPIPHGVQYAGAGEFATAKTSVTLPPLTAGNTYVFVITTAVDGVANMETSPNRSALPTAFANVISAPITVSSGAQKTLIRGDAKAFAELTRRRMKPPITGVPAQLPGR